MKMKKLMVAALATAITIGGTLPSYAAWKETGAEWKYQNEDGSYKASTWFEEAGKKYHFDVNGNAQKGWFKEADKWYFFGYNGVMQTGLIKVDDKVYFMNDDGSLFVGTKKIGNTDYNFTEYGTTNGQPSVVESRTWAGNGNQTKRLGNGGTISSRRDTSDVTTEVTGKVEVILTGIKDSVDSVSLDVSGKSITINATAEADNYTLITEAEAAVIELLKEDNVQEVVVNGKHWSRNDLDNNKLSDAFDRIKIAYENESVDKLLTLIKAKNTSIITTEGVAIDYTLNYTIK